MAREGFTSLGNIGPTASKSVFLRCRVCTQLKKRKETRARCDCPGKPLLCPAPCFAMFQVGLHILSGMLRYVMFGLYQILDVS